MPEDSTRPERLDLALVGVGGQGTILASNVLAELGLLSGYDVKKAEVHGMSQRGGSVVSHVRWGPQVHSPVIAPEGADILVAFEKMEAARYAALLAPRGVAVVNDHEIDPVTVITLGGHYPEDHEIAAAFGPEQRLIWVQGNRIAGELGDRRVANVVVLGALSTILRVPGRDWAHVLAAQVPPELLALNQRAFAAGRAQALVG